jgi:TIGR03009 family protein
LTPDEQTDIDRLLDRWEQWNARVKTFDCKFHRWSYDLVFNPPAPNQPIQPKYSDLGVIKYAAPHRALFRVDKAEKDGKEVPIQNARAEHWVFDGKSLFELSSAKKQLIEHKLPPEFPGSRLVDGPLAFAFPISAFFGLFSLVLGGEPSKQYPFPFGAKAEELKQRYYIHAITPPNRQDQIWLEAYPRSRQYAPWFQKMQLIFDAKDMSPLAMKIVQPNGKDYTSYQFYEVVVNAPPPSANDDPFRPVAPLGWKMTVDRLPLAAEARPADNR